MLYRVVQMVEGRLVVSTFTEDSFIPAMEVRGYPVLKLNSNPRQRAELQGQPIFGGSMCGPMWDGDAVRYEDSATNDYLSA